MGTSLYDEYLKETGGPAPAPALPPLPKPSNPLEDPWVRPPVAAADVTARAPRETPPGQPTIRASKRRLDPKAPDFPTGKKNLETEPRLGDQPIQDMARDLVQGEGLFKPDKPAGVVADLSAAWPLRAGFQAGKEAKEGHPGVAAAMAGMAALPVVGGKAGGAVRRILKDVPFEAYSRLESAVEKAPFERGTAEQWKAALTPNVAAGERQYRGVDNLLEQKQGQTLTKAEIQQHLADNPIKVGRSQYGGTPRSVETGTNGIPIDWKVTNELPHPGATPGWYVFDPNGEIKSVTATRTDAVNDARRLAGEANPRPRFAQYKEPGGSNYTENVLTLDRKKFRGRDLPPGYKLKQVENPNDSFEHEGIGISNPLLDETARELPEGVTPDQYYGANPAYHEWKNRPRTPAYVVEDPQGKWVTDEFEHDYEAVEQLQKKLESKPFKQPGHFPDENPLAHYRHTDHVLPSGEKVRFIEEMQSDWHQKGRKYTYESEVPKLTAEAAEISGKLADDAAYQAGQSTPASLDERLRLSDRLNKLRLAIGNAVPDAPFKKTEEWTELALKDAIDQARKDGIDRIAWTTGDQQAARYDLSQHVDRISYNPQTEILQAWKGNSKLHEGKYDQRALDDVIGKEAAENLLSGDNQVGLEGETTYLLEGEGLKVGGAGMRSYYDKMVPKVVKDYAKKMGVKIDLEPVSIFKPTGGSGFEGPHLSDTQLYAARRNALRDEGDDPESPIVMQIDDIIHRIEAGQSYREAAEQSLAQLTTDMGGDTEHANIVADYLSARYRRPSVPTDNQSFSLAALKDKGAQPLWGAGAAGAGLAVANEQQQGDGKDQGGDLYKQFQKEQGKPAEGGDLYAQFKAEQPKRSIWDRLKDVNAGVRKALVPDALEQLETGASKFGKEQGEWGVQLARDLKYISDPKNLPDPSKPSPPEMRAAERRVLAAIATVALPAGLHKYATEVLAGRGIRVPAPKAPAPERPAWDRTATAPPPVDQPQPLTRPQEVIRARLATEGINPSGAIKRRPAPVVPPPVEPGPEAAAYSTKGAVRRPAPAAAPSEATAQPAPEPATPPEVERRAEPRDEGDVWTQQQRSAYITEQQQKFARSTGNKPWSQWTPEEKQAYFADQDRVKTVIAAAKAKVGPQEFQRRAIAAASEAPGPEKLQAIAGAAQDIVAGETAHYPPEPKPGDLTPVVSSNSEFAARPGVMRAVNRGEQPASLSSPLRLPEPTPADRAVVQPEGYKKVSPEEVAARRPEPVIAERPTRQEPEGAKVDEQGLFFEHRTPGGELRPFNRVSTDGLIKAHREMQDQIVRDQQASIYRNVEADVSGTQYGQHINVGDRTERGTTYQAEAQQRLRNYQKVMGRLDEELKHRGLTNDDVYNRIQAQEEMEAAIEQEAIHHANATDEADTAFDFGDETKPPAGETKAGIPATEPANRATKGQEGEPPASDILNVAKLNLGSKTAEQRMAAKLEEFRSQRDANRQTFAEADVNRAEILNELRAGDPKALPTDRAKKLSGEELLARRDLVRENDDMIQRLSKRLEGAATPEEHQQAAELLDKAVAHNDALLSDLVTGSSQKGRDLNLLRRIANRSLDADVWRVQAKRMLGDRPLTADIDAMIRKLAQEATDACG